MVPLCHDLSCSWLMGQFLAKIWGRGTCGGHLILVFEMVWPQNCFFFSQGSSLALGVP